MSRKRDDKRKKQQELARQMGVSVRDAKEQHHLQEHPRITRPEFIVRELTGPSGLRALVQKPVALTLSLYLRDPGGVRFIGARILQGKTLQWAKTSYNRPAHFIVIVALGDRVDALTAAGTEIAMDDTTLAQADLSKWERLHAVTIEGLSDAVAISIPGTGRTTQMLEARVGPMRFILEAKL